MIIGIDPGASGAIVALTDDFQPVEWMRMPTFKHGKSTRVNGAELARFIHDLPQEVFVGYVESVSSRPGQGVASTFNFGHSLGVVEGVLSALSIPTTMVTPQYWKGRAGLIGKEKDDARAMAIRRWPKWAELGKIGAGQAYADAAFIAIYGVK